MNIRAAHTVFILTRLFMLIFLYSALAKFFDFAEFKSELAKSPFLHPIAGFIAWSVPVSELVIGVLLILRRTLGFALYTYFYMMVAFTCYVFLMMKKAYYLPCACMGLMDDLGWEAHLVVNIAISLLVFVAILLENGTAIKRIYSYPSTGGNLSMSSTITPGWLKPSGQPGAK